MKALYFFSALLAVTFLFAGCGASIEGDAQKAAKVMCDALNGDEAAVEDSKNLFEAIDKKYTSDEDKKKFSEAFEKAFKEECDDMEAPGTSL